MILYHSSSVTVELPDIVHSREFLDFGKGFYLISLQDQALKYALRFARRQQEAWLNSYELTYNPDEWKVIEFTAYDEGWLRFVAKCRAGQDDTDYDMVVGGIADDKVISTLDRFFEGELSIEQTLVKYEKPNNQYCIRSQAMIDECLKHIKSRQL